MATGADAADPHDLARRVHVAELLERVAVDAERRPVRREVLLLHHLAGCRFPLRPAPGLREVFHRHDQGRVGLDPQLAADLGRPPRQHPHAVAGARLGDDVPRLARLPRGEPLVRDLPGNLVEELAHLEVVVPDLERAEPGRLAQSLAVRPDDGHHDVAPVCLREAPVATHDLEAGGKALDVPLPRPRDRLVEVVDVEDHPALGRAEEPEVRQVGVAAHLHDDARRGSGAEIHGHERRSAPVEGERRREHAPVADRDEVLHPRGRLGLEHGDRVRASGGRQEATVTRARRHLAGLLAPGDALVDGQPPAAPRRGEGALGRWGRGSRCSIRGHPAQATAA